MRSDSFLPVLAVIAALVAGGLRGSLRADTVELSGGGHVSGEVRRVSDAKVPYVVVKLDPELRVALPESRVRRVVTSEELAEYRRRAAIAADNADLHYELARWCSGNHLSAQYRYHMQRAIEIDPDHAYARAALQYVQEQGEWVRHADLQRRRGMISVGGRWKLPEAVAIERVRDDTDTAAKKWIRDITRLRSAAMRGGEAGAAAIASLNAIEDPLAAPAIASELKDSRSNNSQPRSLRLLWVALLARFQNMTAVEALVRAGVEESDDVVREAALERLQHYGSGSAIATYRAMLRSNSNRDVQRAARALSFFPDPELALPLVDALVTEHKRVKPAGAGTQAGFTSDGSGSFTSGSKAQTIIQRVENRPVLTVLKMIEPGVDYGFNEVKWQEHFARKLTAYNGDLRRDP